MQPASQAHTTYTTAYNQVRFVWASCRHAASLPCGQQRYAMSAAYLDHGAKHLGNVGVIAEEHSQASNVSCSQHILRVCASVGPGSSQPQLC